MTIRVYLISEDVKFDDVVFHISEDSIVLGRSVRADVQIVHPLISRLHCEWHLVEGDLVLRDLGSTNQTILNGEPIDDAVLQSGDRLLLGDVPFAVEIAVDGAEQPNPANEIPAKDRVKASDTDSEMPTTRMTSKAVSAADSK